jgi:hypothetical protein
MALLIAACLNQTLYQNADYFYTYDQKKHGYETLTLSDAGDTHCKQI